MNHYPHCTIVHRSVDWQLFAIWLMFVALLATSAPRAMAENWQQVEIRVSPARAGHTYWLQAPYSSEQTPYAWSEGLFELQSPDGSFTKLQVWVDVDQPFSLMDANAGDFLEISLAG